MTYLLDSNVFIQAKNLHYGFDFCPAFWGWIDLQNGGGVVFSVEKVGTELTAGGDLLAEWAAARGAALFLAPDKEMLEALARVSAWVTEQAFEPAAVSTFFSGGRLLPDRSRPGPCPHRDYARGPAGLG